MRVLKLLLLLALAVLVVTACRPAEAEREDAPIAVAPAIVTQVRVIQPETGVLTTTRSASVTLRPAQESLVASGASARVQEVLQREGSRVEAGEVVVKLEDDAARFQRENARVALESARINLRAAERATQDGSGQREAQLRSAQTNLNLARRQLEEAQALAQVGGVATSDLQALEAQLAQAESGFGAAQDAINRAGRAGDEDLALLRLQIEQAENGLAQAEKALEETRVKAPFSGEVVEVMVEVGEFVGAGSPVFRLASVTSLQARFRVPPEDASGLPIGSQISIHYAGRSYDAEISRSAQVPGQDRLVELTAVLVGGNLPVGAVARLEYSLELADGLVLPASAVQLERGEEVVYTAVNGLAYRNPVRLLAESDGRTVVSGLSGDARVIHPLPAGLQDGAEVEVLGS